jgi:transmembrane sensor
VFKRRESEIEAEAAEWTVRLAHGPLQSAERRAFEQWLVADPAHAAAFDHAQSIWAATSALKRAPGRLADARPARVERGWARPAAAIGALGACAALAVFWFGDPMLRLEADYSTAPGQQRDIALADGSHVQLDTASALAVRFDGRERRVELLAGEAYFTAAPRTGAETRPFVVAAGDGTVTALGTQFMVQRDGGAVDVIAAEHLLSVSVASGALVLQPGQSVRYDSAHGLAAATEVDLQRATAWRRGRLIFDKVALADVVAALNRYRRGRIVIAGSALAERRVSGAFEVGDLDQALAAIVQELGAHTAVLPPFVTILF